MPQADPESIKEILARTDPGLRNALENLKKALPEDSYLAKEVKEFKQAILKTPERAEQRIFSFLPHQMAKTSIFFPMSDKELKEENRKINRIEQKTAWGKVIIEGIKLAIFEEDILIALLTNAKSHTQKDGEGRYALKIRMPEIAKILYQDQGYTKTVYHRIDRALAHFGLIRFEIVVDRWHTKDNKKTLEEKKTTINGIISGHSYDPETHELTIYWNERFFVYFLDSMLTNIDLTLRRKLKKDGSKALLRFLCAHRQPGYMHILTVLNAINYNTNQPLFRLRSHLKSFVLELKKHGILGPKTRVSKDDTVYFDVLKPQKYSPNNGGNTLPD